MLRLKARRLTVEVNMAVFLSIIVSSLSLPSPAACLPAGPAPRSSQLAAVPLTLSNVVERNISRPDRRMVAHEIQIEYFVRRRLIFVYILCVE